MRYQEGCGALSRRTKLLSFLHELEIVGPGSEKPGAAEKQILISYSARQSKPVAGRSRPGTWRGNYRGNYKWNT